MDVLEMFQNNNEKPLEKMVDDGGYTGIFRTIACVGDSLSSGEFESLNELGEKGYHDMYEYSWGQYLARMIGSEVYNFSRGGMTGVEYCESFAKINDFWNQKYASQAYIIALGVNDLVNGRSPKGSYEDVDLNDWHNNSQRTFIGCYATIIQRLKEIQPRAKFFLMTMPCEGENDPSDAIRREHRDILYWFKDHFENTYILDFYQYAPIYDEAFKEIYYMGHHLNPMGYILTSKLVASYIDYIIRHNYQDFKEVGYIGTDLHYYR